MNGGRRTVPMWTGPAVAVLARAAPPLSRERADQAAGAISAMPYWTPRAGSWLDDRFAGKAAPTSCVRIPAGNSLEPEKPTVTNARATTAPSSRP